MVGSKGPEVSQGRSKSVMDDGDVNGYAVLHEPALNKSTAFSLEERERFGLRGLLPARVLTQDLQVGRVLENLRRKTSDIEKYIFLMALQGRNERLFYRVLIDNIDELMPLVYTPTVGQACKEFAHIFRQTRVRGHDYDQLIDEFVLAVQDAYPRALIQFEDFLTPNAYALLHRYRDRVLCFLDDIQGTAAVILAGLYSASRVTAQPVDQMRIMFLGAGSAAAGIGDLIVSALTLRGVSTAEARSRLWFVDSKGLVVQSRDVIKPHVAPYAHDHPAMGFVDAIRAVRPHVLIGATGRAGMFTEEVVRLMSEINDRPVVFALSNPTSRSECTAEQANRWSGERVVFASGSPFPPIDRENGQVWRPGQGNNAYIFPGVGLGVVACEATTVTDRMFLAAAQALADTVSSSNLAEGDLYPRLSEIRRVSLAIATEVAEAAYAEGVATVPRPDSLADHIAAQMYVPSY